MGLKIMEFEIDTIAHGPDVGFAIRDPNPSLPQDCIICLIGFYSGFIFTILLLRKVT